MDETAADIPGAGRHVVVRSVYSDVVLDLLDGKFIDGTLLGAVDHKCDEVIYECNGVRIASDVDGVRSVACTQPCHTSGKAYALLSQRIAELRVPTAASEQGCPVCKNSGWLPITSREAHQQYTMMRAVGWFRGILIPQLQVRKRRADEPTDKHPVPTVWPEIDDPSSVE